MTCSKKIMKKLDLLAVSAKGVESGHAIGSSLGTRTTQKKMYLESK